MLLLLVSCLTVENFPAKFDEAACAWDRRCTEFATASDEAGFECSEEYFQVRGPGASRPDPCVTLNEANAAACIDNFRTSGCDVNPLGNPNCMEWCERYDGEPLPE